jgi:threonine dehydratase
MGLKIKLVGVVSSRAPAYAESFERKTVIEMPATTKVADGMACRKPEPEALAILLGNVDHIARVSVDEVEESMRHMFTDTHNVVEGVDREMFAQNLQGAERPAAISAKFSQ